MPILKPNGHMIRVDDYTMRVEYGSSMYYIHPNHNPRDVLIPHRSMGMLVTIGQIISKSLAGGEKEMYFVPQHEIPVSEVIPYIPA